jgi:hypothetical protein
VRPCSVCGNDIPERVRTCPFCERAQVPAPVRSSRSRSGVLTVSVKDGMPTAAAAVVHLDLRLQTVRAGGGGLVRVIHGWGSTGQGGTIRTAVRNHLRELQRRGQVRAYVPGEDYSETEGAGRRLRERYPSLRTSTATDSLNPGITFVEV